MKFSWISIAWSSISRFLKSLSKLSKRSRLKVAILVANRVDKLVTLKVAPTVPVSLCCLFLQIRNKLMGFSQPWHFYLPWWKCFERKPYTTPHCIIGHGHERIARLSSYGEEFHLIFFENIKLLTLVSWYSGWQVAIFEFLTPVVRKDLRRTSPLAEATCLKLKSKNEIKRIGISASTYKQCTLLRVYGKAAWIQAIIGGVFLLPWCKMDFLSSVVFY